MLDDADTQNATMQNGSEMPCTLNTSMPMNTTQQLIAMVDRCAVVTEARPPERAEQETRRQFETLTPGNETTSYYPAHATRVETAVVADAHATIFGVHPATVLTPVGSETPQLLLAPNGTVRVFTDYRLRSQVLNESSVVTHGVEQVRLLHNETVVAAQQTPSQRATLAYTDLPPGPGRLTVEVDIRVVRDAPSTGVESTDANEQTSTVVTVRDERQVTVTAVTPETVTVTQATGLSDDVVVAVGHPRWRTVDVTTQPRETTQSPGGLDDDGTGANTTATVRVQNAWRFTVDETVDEGWATSYWGTATGATQSQTSPTPVYVRAIRSERLRDRTYQRPTPASVEHAARWEGVPQNQRADGMDEPVETGSWATVRVHETDRPTVVQVKGLVRGERTTVDLTTCPMHRTQPPQLSVTVQPQTATTATLVVELRQQTGVPIQLEAMSPTTGSQIAPRLLVDGTPIATDANGRAVIQLSEQGTHRVAFQPGVLRPGQSDTTYSTTGTAVTATWHPLNTPTGWLDLLAELLSWALLGIVIVYLGRHSGRFFQRRE